MEMILEHTDVANLPALEFRFVMLVLQIDLSFFWNASPIIS